MEFLELVLLRFKSLNQFKLSEFSGRNIKPVSVINVNVSN